MEARTNKLIEIRPQIIIEGKNSSPLELFQSNTLRPILKFQNELVLVVFANYLLENRVDFLGLKDDKKEELIHVALKKNLALKNILIGLTIGLFSKEEFLFYIQFKSEINKRIIELLIKRISDQKEKIELFQRDV